MTYKLCAVLFLSISLQACAAGGGDYMHQTQQQISIESTPASAVCIGTRAGVQIFSIAKPQAVTVDKSKDPIELACTAPGYATAHQTISSSRDSLSWSPLWDMASGAAWIYPASVPVSLVHQ